MAIILSPVAKQQFIDNNDVPMANCELWTYKAGTSSMLATFSDSTGTAYNSNPIILDAGGRAEIWLDSSIAYKFVLLNRDGSVLWTVDNINSSASSGLSVNVDTIAALKAINTTNYTKAIANVAGYSALNDGGGGTFYFNSSSTLTDDGGIIIAPTTGSGRWIREASSEINVAWYGANGDGSTNNTSIFQSADTYAVANKCSLFIPNGTFNLTSNPGLASQVRFSPLAILKFSGFSLPINVVIEDTNNRHFTCLTSATVNFSKSVTKVYPEWFGALGDGSMANNTPGTDDTAAIQQALNSCPVGCAVVFNTTKKYWTGTLNPLAGTALIGSQSFENEDFANTGTASEFLANLQYNSSGTALIDLSNSTVGGLRGVKIEGFILDGTAQATSVIKLETQGSLVSKCTIRNAAYGITFGGATNASMKNRVECCNIRNCTTAGITNSGATSTYNFVSNVNFTNCAKDVDLTVPGGWVVNNIVRSSGIVESYENAPSVYQIEALGATPNDSQLVESTGGWGDNSSTFSSNTNAWKRTFLVRQSSATDYTGVRIHDALTRDAANVTPNVDTRAWYGRDFLDGSHHWGDQTKDLMALDIAPRTTDSAGILSVANLNFGNGAVQFSGMKTIRCDVGTLNYQINNNLLSVLLYASNTHQEIIPWYRYPQIPEDLTTTSTWNRSAGLQTQTVPIGQTYLPGDYVVITASMSRATWLAGPWYNEYYLWGVVTAYDIATGALTVNIKKGTYVVGGTLVNAHIMAAFPWFPQGFYISYLDTIDNTCHNLATSPINVSWAEAHGISLQTVNLLCNF